MRTGALAATWPSLLILFVLFQEPEPEDDLEALRMAALASMKPKKSVYKVQAHPVRSNLLSIVPVEPEVVKQKPVLKPAPAKPSLPASPRDSKFSRFADDR